MFNARRSFILVAATVMVPLFLAGFAPVGAYRVTAGFTRTATVELAAPPRLAPRRRRRLLATNTTTDNVTAANGTAACTVSSTSVPEDLAAATLADTGCACAVDAGSGGRLAPDPTATTCACCAADAEQCPLYPQACVPSAVTHTDRT